MITWMRAINWMKVLWVGVLFTIVSTIVRQAEMVLTLRYYMDPNYFGVWSKLMMPAAGPPPFEFLITSLLITFTTGVSLTLIYYYIRDFLPKGTMKRTLLFADLMIGTSFIFFTLPVYLLFHVPLMLLVSWFVSGFIITVAASFIIIRVIGK